MEDDFRDFNLLNSINSIKSRSSLTLAFDSGSSGLAHTEVLICLTLCYLGQKKDHLELLTKNDGFMIKTIPDIELLTRQKAGFISTILQDLENLNLIEIAPRRKGSFTKIKVNLDNVNSFLNEAIIKAEENDKEKLTDKKIYREAKKERRNKSGKVDIDKLNQLSEENDPKKIFELTNDTNIASLVYCTNHYYRQITNKTFIWKLGDFNTMMQPWRDRWFYKGAELGLAVAIYKAIEDKSFNKPFGLKVKSYFSIQPGRTDIPAELKFDNLLSA